MSLLQELAEQLEQVPVAQWREQGIYYATELNSQEVCITLGFNFYGGIATWIDVLVNNELVHHGAWLFWTTGITRRFLNIHRRVETGLHAIAHQQAIDAATRAVGR